MWGRVHTIVLGDSAWRWFPTELLVLAEEQWGYPEGAGLFRATLTLSSCLLRGLMSHCIAILKVIL